MRVLLAVSGALVALSLTACGRSTSPRAAATGSTSQSEPVADTDMPTTGPASVGCSDKTTPDPAAAQKVPRGFPTVAGWVATEAVTQGKTLLVRGSVKGDPDEIGHVRDAAVAKLTAAGYKRSGGDEEPGFEADADFTGPHDGNINVRALCRDYLLVSYTIEH